MFDLHTHHNRCGHAEGTLREMVEAAIEAGLDTIGLSDHSPFFAEPVDHFKTWVAMAKSEFPKYVAEAIALRAEYRERIAVLVGVESDFFDDHRELYREIYSRYPLDYVIGSVHVLGELDIFNPARWEGADLLDEKEMYCAAVGRAARSGLFDILGHVDAIKGNCPKIAEIQTPAVDRMLRDIAESDVVMEINTSGSTKPVGGWYPAPDVLERAAYLGVKVTFGSDAHRPGRIGEDFEAVREHLRGLGYRDWYIFRDRMRHRRPL
ncbi:histidinol-phosphatase [Nocardia goodfellowii]|uniref:Histidinol-phosphatase n=1 Tax=Nocardia goodfellowii TaxID=882446 RepID=A0ABS4QG89_9NOCA|nr:histidinol-phosphatase [Nocardia goodfellowii]MBP2189686.1 histidinol-phosphatase (PHP family) [Nocardia goodfellowii]